MEMKPTQEQIKEFWEWCGFKQTHKVKYYDKDKKPYKAWLNPDGNEDNWTYSLPPIDLNNLFEYAVPKLVADGYSINIETALADEPWYWWIIERGGEMWKADNRDPALALFWALHNLITTKEGRDNANI